MGAWCETGNGYATIKKNEKTVAQTQAGGIIMGAQCNKVRIFATGEVFFLEMRRLKPAGWWECKSPTMKV